MKVNENAYQDRSTAEPKKLTKQGAKSTSNITQPDVLLPTVVPSIQHLDQVKVNRSVQEALYNLQLKANNTNDPSAA